VVVDVETTGTNPDRDKIIEFGICLFECDRQSGRIYRVLGSWEWFEDPGVSIPPEITKITGITDEMVAGHRIDEAPSTNGCPGLSNQYRNGCKPNTSHVQQESLQCEPPCAGQRLRQRMKGSPTIACGPMPVMGSGSITFAWSQATSTAR
jgi:hypothetical protein